jgi:thioesterase domain-containing protein
MANTLSSEKREVLSRIWQRVLKKEHIGVDETFFYLGGNPWQAVDLFREIEKEFGRSLPPMVIFQAPTIASLAVLLENHDNPTFPKQVLLKAGNQEPGIFLMHGVGGNILEFFGFAKHLRCSRAVYGVQARGTDGWEEPCSSIEEMAEFHVDAIKSLQPRGPYVLVGYSLGGLVALETARLLTTTGENIDLLAMIDSYPPLLYAPLAQRLGVYMRRATHGASRLLRSPGPAGPAKDPGSLGMAFTPAMRRVQEYAMKALRGYRPRHYRGQIRFVRAGTPLHLPADPAKVWTKFADQFEVETVTGDHHELLTTYCDSLASVISRYLCELSVQKSTGLPH